MKLASYNLFEGAQSTVPMLAEMARQESINVLCIQEANGWNEGSPSQVERFGQLVDMPNFVFGDSNTRFKLATFSGLTVVRSTVEVEGFWHSAVQTEIDHEGTLLNIWNVHLDPWSEDKRLAEAERLIQLAGDSPNTIITGDFNSLSEADNYPSTLIDDLAQKGIKKFGTSHLRYDVTRAFSQAGLVDIGAIMGLTPDSNTVPTPANQDAYHAAPMRLDYMFASEGLLDSVRDFRIIRNGLTDQISDHYPIMVELK